MRDHELHHSPPAPPPLPPHSEDKAWISSAPMPLAPPPPPPLLYLPKKSSSASVAPLPPPPPSAEALEPLDKAHYLQFIDTKQNIPGRLFQLFHMFFYGSLMDSEVLQAILGLPELPTTKPTTIHGFQTKMWGIYPTLLRSNSGSVDGTVWEVTSQPQFDRLAAYETAAYRWVDCDTILEGGEVLENCRTFCWAGEPDSMELEDGSFDLERYRKYFKPSITRRR